MKNQRPLGYTLIELMMVVVILSVLTTVGVAAFSGLREEATQQEAYARLPMLHLAQKQYHSLNGTYAANLNQLSYRPNELTGKFDYRIDSADPNTWTASAIRQEQYYGYRIDQTGTISQIYIPRAFMIQQEVAHNVVMTQAPMSETYTAPAQPPAQPQDPPPTP
jgi:prepilin-type N-terminal cleavage/methylation domain-containing protein